MFERLLGFGTTGAQLQPGAAGGGQHHDPHDTLAVDFAPTAQQPNLGVEARRQGNEFGGGAGVQSQFVDDDDFPFQHPGVPLVSGRHDGVASFLIILVLDDGP